MNDELVMITKKWIKLGHTIPNMIFLVQRKQQQVNVVFRRIDEIILVSYNSIFRINRRDFNITK